MAKAEMIYMAIGFVCGMVFVSMFWIDYVDDLREIIELKERLIRSLKRW